MNRHFSIVTLCIVWTSHWKQSDCFLQDNTFKQDLNVCSAPRYENSALNAFYNLLDLDHRELAS